MGEFVKVAKANALSENSGMLVEVQNRRIALFRSQDGYCAIDNACPHRGGPLSDGEVDGNEVLCPWHGARFNIKAGEALSPPALQGVSAYVVRVERADVKIEL